MTVPMQPRQAPPPLTSDVGRRRLPEVDSGLNPAGCRRSLATVAQLACYLGDTERHIRKLIFERRIPVVRVGGKVRFNLDAIDAWLDEHTEAPEPLPRPAGQPRW